MRTSVWGNMRVWGGTQCYGHACVCVCVCVCVTARVCVHVHVRVSVQVVQTPTIARYPIEEFQGLLHTVTVLIRR